MIKRYRDLLRVVVADLRHTLSGGSNGQRGDLDRELERLGIGPDGMVTPFDALPNPSPAERRARRVAEAQLAAAPTAQRAATRAEIVERAAYTWINRLLALRAIEARGLINEILRSDPAYDCLSEALFILRQTQPQRAAGPDGGWRAVIEDACTAQASSLGGLFDLADPSAALRPSTPALLRCVAIIGTTHAGFAAEEADAAFADPDAIGWAYQFYQEEAKARTYAKLNSGGKAATRAEIAAVTQLFTEPYMVKWLLQNSLGRTYHELYPDSRLPETWEYYIRDLPGRDDRSPAITSLENLTFMDPCMGSGHFEREAFDMYAAMYREQYPGMTATEIADRILTHHLHGIDLDPRAAQLAALTLYLRAWELVRDERRAQRLPGPGAYRPPAMNLATTPTGLTTGSLERHLQRHTEDRIYRPLLAGIFTALEQADVLGSLLRPGEQLDAAIRAFRTQGSGQLGLLSEDDDLNRLLDELARHDPAELKRVLLARVARSFAADAADADDVAMMLFGREASEGLRLLQLLERRYQIVVTNPPYMGSKHMANDLRAWIELLYSTGRRDLYSAFILRCIELTLPTGRVGMVTMQGWMFLRSFAELRSLSTQQPTDSHRQNVFPGLLVATAFESIAHLGANAFEEISGEVVQSVLFVTANHYPSAQHRMTAFRLVDLSAPNEKDRALRQPNGSVVFQLCQANVLLIPEAPLVYWLGPRFVELLREPLRLRDVVDVKQGLATTDNARFLRYFWEVGALGTVENGVPAHGRWFRYSKGGRYQKWTGLQWLVVDWFGSGARIKAFVVTLPGTTHWSRRVANEPFYFRACLTYTQMARGSMATRVIADSIFDVKGMAIFGNPSYSTLTGIGAFLSTHTASFLLRVTTQNLEFHAGYVANLPLPSRTFEQFQPIADACLALKHRLVSSDPTEADFGGATSLPTSAIAAFLHTIEGFGEALVVQAYKLDPEHVRTIENETGLPAGWLPLVKNLDSLPHPLDDLADFETPAGLAIWLADRPRIHLSSNGLSELLADVRTALESRSSAGIDVSDDDSPIEGTDAEDGDAIVTRVPIPTETFVEEMSQKLQIHPISVYWLLEGLRAEGVRCKPEELRLLEDRLSVLILRLLGHRWPRQIEAGEPVPSWADPDGIIPLTTVAGETGLAERVRNRLRAEDGDRGAQQIEALLLELTNQPLEEWLRRSFFPRHVRQFKHRPIAWHLASTPTKDGGRRTKARREPAFECLLYYHACHGDVLARLRAHYVEPLIRLEAAAAADARRRGDETAAAIAVSRVHELEEFATRLHDVEEAGFACAELDRLLADEPLDRWGGDGIVPPASTDELAAQERAWRVDINDGVRVNVAPLQLAGMLTGDVLRPDDARKAIADRARWRSDERRWVREGVLPRCGWMDEDVPESPRWTERAPEREAEQRKLEEKRRTVMARLKPQPPK